MYRVNHTEEEKRIFDEIMRGGAVALFLYSSKLIYKGERREYVEGHREVRPVAKGGVMMAPVTFFVDILGKDVTPFAHLTRTVRGVEYLPFIECARALGYAAQTFYEDRLAVVGTEDDVAAMRKGGAALAEAGAYAVIGEYDVSSFTREDYRAVRKRWAEVLVGSPEINDLSNPIIKKKIEQMSANAEGKWAEMHKEPDRLKLWGDGPPVESVELGTQYINLATLARAWGTYGSTLYHNDELARDIVEGMKWMYENMYGEAEMEGRGWRNVHLFNWWDWYIPTPTAMTDVFFIMEEYFPLELRRKYLKCFEWITTELFTDDTRHHSLGRVEIYAKCAIATEKPEMLEISNSDFDWLLEICETGNGPRIDYVHWAHSMPYNNAYGRMLVARLLNVAYVLTGTALEYTSPRAYNLFNIAKYMYETASYKGNGMSMMMGRQNYVKEFVTGASMHAGLTRLIGMFGEDEDEYMMDMFARQAEGGEDFINSANRQATIAEVTLFDKILKRDRVVPRYNYAHAWFTGDRAVQHRNEYAFAISLSSHRGLAFESICNVNGCGWHLGDGATHLYTTYDIHAFDNDNFYLKNVNLAQHFPGTTEDVRARLDRPISCAENYYAPNDFAGSMQIGTEYVVAGMDFISYNIQNRPEKKYGEGYSAPNFENDLVAKKSYFCFDKEMVCLGAGINSTMNSEVVTTIDHKRVVDPERDMQYVNGEKMENGRVELGPGYVNFDRHAGYVIMSEGAYANRYVCDTAAGQTFFEVGISHGKNPENATYAYAVLPYSDNESLEKYASAPEVEILANNERVQCVRKPSLGITAYVFHEAADIGGIKAHGPAIVALSEGRLQICDPTQKQDKLVITFWGEMLINSLPEKVEVDIANGMTVFTVDTARAYGRPFIIDFTPVENNMYYRVLHTDEEKERVRELTREGAVGLFLYSDSVLSGGELSSMGERVVKKNDVLMAPVSFFEKYLGGGPEGERVRIGGVDYLPILATARAMGYDCEAFYDGRFVFIGAVEQVDVIRNNPVLEEAGAYACFPPYDPTRFTHEDYKDAKDRWRERIVGSPKINDLSDPAIANKIKWFDYQAEKSLSTINQGPDRKMLWGEGAPVESEDLWTQYKNVLSIAIAWGTYGSKYYQDPDALATVLDSIEWLYLNMYGEAEIEGRGWRSVHEFNWWHWFSGAPDCLTDTMLIVEEHLTMEQKQKYLKCYVWLRTVMWYWNNMKDRAGSINRLGPSTKTALLLEDAGMLRQSQRDCDSALGAEEYGASVHKADYVNWTHSYPHNISYGAGHLRRTLFILSVLAPTKLDFTGPKKYNQFDLVRYCFEPAIYKAQGFVMFSGRSTFGKEKNYGASILALTVPMIGAYGADEDEYIKRYIKRQIANNPETEALIKAEASLYN
ncbi:MAG: hypothetical protein J6Q69_05075, partial [Clostridia bacterium]|nr:hypothetical protein [Clostridia bacterium]